MNHHVDLQSLRKAEHRVEQERKQTGQSLRDALERAKKAEANLLEFKLEMGIKLLVRAQDDCQNNIKQLDDMTKRYAITCGHELSGTSPTVHKLSRLKIRHICLISSFIYY